MLTQWDFYRQLVAEAKRGLTDKYAEEHVHRCVCTTGSREMSAGVRWRG